jgi:uncharacterized protein
MSKRTPAPSIRELDAKECHAILARHQVGRLAFAHKDRVDVEPIHFVHDDGWIYGRTAPGTKLEVVSKNRWVAFEVDEVRALFDWASVVAKGGFYFLRKDGSEQEVALYDEAVAILRRLIPETLTPDDPMPERVILFRIHIDELTGRACTPVAR